MGLRFSKSAVNQCNAPQQKPQLQERHIHEEEPYEEPRRESSVLAPINITADASDINYHLPVTPTPTFSNQSHLQRPQRQLHEVGSNAASAEELVEATATSPNLSSSCPARQIIIKIQLAKMENDQPAKENNNNNNSSCRKARSLTMPSSNSSNNNMDDSSQFLNVAFNQSATEARQGDYIPKKGAQHFLVNNNFSSSLVLAPAAPNNESASSSPDNSINLLMGPISELQLSESHPSVLNEAASIDSTSTKETADEPTYEVPQNNCGEGGDTVEVDSEFCCRRKAKSNTFPSKWRCCRCTCRDAFKRIMDASSSATSSASASSSSASSKVSKKKERKEARSLMKCPQKSVLKKQQQPQHSSQQPALWAAVQPNAHQLQMQGNNSAAGGTSSENAAAHMSIWSPSKNDVIIPISSPQFVVVQCPPSSLVTLGRMDDNSIRLMATELVSSTASSSASSSNTPPRTQATPNADCGSISNGSAIVPGPVVHSQVDYIHCLVPDLERITKASFYWGKMDRYEAERLLEGKPEGTFLLRDSAQEEYLFSVTFRKYGRSLHARIEQSNHKFSFDCHDPCVFTASTVTGLLEHYKDPACVMFFEPMLTIPLHRNTTFTLQQLCRATIVSNTSYDGINELELPTRLKCYLKEYHYKQKLRVKPFDEPFYSCT